MSNWVQLCMSPLRIEPAGMATIQIKLLELSEGALPKPAGAWGHVRGEHCDRTRHSVHEVEYHAVTHLHGKTQICQVMSLLIAADARIEQSGRGRMQARAGKR